MAHLPSQDPYGYSQQHQQQRSNSSKQSSYIIRLIDECNAYGLDEESTVAHALFLARAMRMVWMSTVNSNVVFRKTG